MIHEFTNNVQRLLGQIVTDRQQNTIHDADELLTVLMHKAPLPIHIVREQGVLRLVYDNVSIEVPHDLSNMQVAYNSDYQVTLEDLSRCDVHQLATFIQALEHDISLWHHIWTAEKKVREMLPRMEKRIQSVVSEMQTVFSLQLYPLKDEDIQLYRMKYYNQKACQLLLSHGDPYWKNKATEQEILDQFRLYQIDVPIESWRKEYDELLVHCGTLKEERDRIKEEEKRKREKLQHLINIKRLKLSALINAIELHPEFEVTVHQVYGFKRLTPKTCFYHIHFYIKGEGRICSIRYDRIDERIPKILDAIRQVNNLVPELIRMADENGLRCYFWSKRLGPTMERINSIIDELK